MTDRLLQQVKRKLNITWNDDDTNARIEDMVKSAIPEMLYILGIADPNFDFADAGTENTLFLAYCLYEYNHCLNEFQDNYSNMIAQTRAKHEVKHYKAKEVDRNEAEI